MYFHSPGGVTNSLDSSLLLLASQNALRLHSKNPFSRAMNRDTSANCYPIFFSHCNESFVIFGHFLSLSCFVCHFLIFLDLCLGLPS